MDDPLSSTPADDIIFDKTNDSINLKPDPKDDSVILAQPATDPSVTPFVPSTEPVNVENLFSQDVQNKNDENP